MGHNTYSAYTDIFPWFLGGIGLEDPGVGSAAWASGSTEMMRCHASHNAICAEDVPLPGCPCSTSLIVPCYPCSIRLFAGAIRSLVTCAWAPDLSVPEHGACHCYMEGDGCAVNCTSRERLMSCG
jgi:hypothetical protein